MSRIGKKSIALPTGVTLEQRDGVVVVTGPQGELSMELLPEVSISIDGQTVNVQRTTDTKDGRSRHGLTRALIANMVEGVSKGFEKRLEIQGVGYKAQGKGAAVTLNLGYSNPIEYSVQKGVEVHNDPQNKQILVVSGINKEHVGQVAAELRSLRKPEPYKGKGIRYQGEQIIRKVGKAAAKAE